MTDSSSSHPIITLLTDFGTRDYFVGAMKGVIFSINPEVQIVDITHDIPPQDIEAAAFNLLACYQDFLAATIHVAVVDPGVGSNRRAIVIECANQFFVGPDNGLFSWICEREGNFRAVDLTNDKFFRHPVSSTFHGRDIFAPAAAAISKGAAIEDFGALVETIVLLESLEPKKAERGIIEGSIIHIDRFGNCITNLTRDHLSAVAKLIINGRELEFRSFFAAGGMDDGDLFYLFGSAGFAEIVARDRSAAEILEARRGQPVIALTGRIG
jgi:S-adenosylmethionine hydrolase